MKGGEGITKEHLCVAHRYGQQYGGLTEGRQRLGLGGGVKKGKKWEQL